MAAAAAAPQGKLVKRTHADFGANPVWYLTTPETRVLFAAYADGYDPDRPDPHYVLYLTPREAALPDPDVDLFTPRKAQPDRDEDLEPLPAPVPTKRDVHRTLSFTVAHHPQNPSRPMVVYRQYDTREDNMTVFRINDHIIDESYAHYLSNCLVMDNIIMPPGPTITAIEQWWRESLAAALLPLLHIGIRHGINVAVKNTDYAYEHGTGDPTGSYRITDRKLWDVMRYLRNALKVTTHTYLTRLIFPAASGTNDAKTIVWLFHTSEYLDAGDAIAARYGRSMQERSRYALFNPEAYERAIHSTARRANAPILCQTRTLTNPLAYILEVVNQFTWAVKRLEWNKPKFYYLEYVKNGKTYAGVRITVNLLTDDRLTGRRIEELFDLGTVCTAKLTISGRTLHVGPPKYIVVYSAEKRSLEPIYEPLDAVTSFLYACIFQRIKALTASTPKQGINTIKQTLSWPSVSPDTPSRGSVDAYSVDKTNTKGVVIRRGIRAERVIVHETIDTHPLEAVHPKTARAGQEPTDMPAGYSTCYRTSRWVLPALADSMRQWSCCVRRAGAADAGPWHLQTLGELLETRAENGDISIQITLAEFELVPTWHLVASFLAAGTDAAAPKNIKDKIPKKPDGTALVDVGDILLSTQVNPDVGDALRNAGSLPGASLANDVSMADAQESAVVDALEDACLRVDVSGAPPKGPTDACMRVLSPSRIAQVAGEIAHTATASFRPPKRTSAFIGSAHASGTVLRRSTAIVGVTDPEFGTPFTLRPPQPQPPPPQPQPQVPPGNVLRRSTASVGIQEGGIQDITALRRPQTPPVSPRPPPPRPPPFSASAEWAKIAPTIMYTRTDYVMQRMLLHCRGGDRWSRNVVGGIPPQADVGYPAWEKRHTDVLVMDSHFECELGVLQVGDRLVRLVTQRTTRNPAEVRRDGGPPICYRYVAEEIGIVCFTNPAVRRVFMNQTSLNDIMHETLVIVRTGNTYSLRTMAEIYAADAQKIAEVPARPLPTNPNQRSYGALFTRGMRTIHPGWDADAPAPMEEIPPEARAPPHPEGEVPGNLSVRRGRRRRRSRSRSRDADLDLDRPEAPAPAPAPAPAGETASCAFDMIWLQLGPEHRHSVHCPLVYTVVKGGLACLEIDPAKAKGDPERYKRPRPESVQYVDAQRGAVFPRKNYVVQGTTANRDFRPLSNYSASSNGNVMITCTEWMLPRELTLGDFSPGVSKYIDTNAVWSSTNKNLLALDRSQLGIQVWGRVFARNEGATMMTQDMAQIQQAIAMSLADEPAAMVGEEEAAAGGVRVEGEIDDGAGVGGGIGGVVRPAGEDDPDRGLPAHVVTADAVEQAIYDSQVMGSLLPDEFDAIVARTFASGEYEGMEYLSQPPPVID